jgi:hypothetical protein
MDRPLGNPLRCAPRIGAPDLKLPSISPGHGAAALGTLDFPAGHSRLVGNPMPAG